MQVTGEFFEKKIEILKKNGLFSKLLVVCSFLLRKIGFQVSRVLTVLEMQLRMLRLWLGSLFCTFQNDFIAFLKDVFLWIRDNLPKDNLWNIDSGTICQIIFGKLFFTFGKLSFGNVPHICFLLLRSV